MAVLPVAILDQNRCFHSIALELFGNGGVRKHVLDDFGEVVTNAKRQIMLCNKVNKAMFTADFN